jgi:hypothetical protein
MFNKKLFQIATGKLLVKEKHALKRRLMSKIQKKEIANNVKKNQRNSTFLDLAAFSAGFV